jgi:two-component system response regulator YesN
MKSKILLVDDDREFRTEFKKFFDDHEIIEGSCAKDAFKILAKPNDIGIVFLDCVMPGMNGLLAIKKIKQYSPTTKIIMLTGYGSKDVIVEALRAQVDDFLEKPIDIKRTREIIEKTLKLEGKKIERIKNFIQRNITKNARLQDISENINLSPKYISRFFKTHTGSNLSNYKINLRIERAKVLLKETEYTIANISNMIGYQNQESFIRQFKKRVGKTPTEYRKKIVGGISCGTYHR